VEGLQIQGGGVFNELLINFRSSCYKSIRYELVCSKLSLGNAPAADSLGAEGL